MKLQKHHLLFIFPLIVSAFTLESTVWLFQRFNRFFLPSSFMFDALLVSFVPFAIYWHMKNWATCSKSARAVLVFLDYICFAYRYLLADILHGSVWMSLCAHE